MNPLEKPSVNLFSTEIDEERWLRGGISQLLADLFIINENSDFKDLYQKLFLFFDGLSDEDFRCLLEKKRLKLFLELTPFFKEEQQQLAFLLAQHHLKSAKKAGSLPASYQSVIDYAAIALKISEADLLFSKDVHLFASRFFFQQVKKESFYSLKTELLDALQTGDRLRFNHHLERVENLKRFCFHPLEKGSLNHLFKAAYQGIRDFSETIQPETPEFYQTAIAQAIVNSKKPLHIDTLTITERYFQELQNYRKLFDQLENNKDLRGLQQTFLESFQQFFKTLITDILTILGPPPCTFDVRAMGSLAREEPCPFSDLEFMILIKNDDESSQTYFRELCQILHYQIRLFGEKNILLFNFTAVTPKEGLHIDLGGDPLKEPKLIGTPFNIAQWQNSTETDVKSIENTLLKTASLYANDLTLYNEYQKALNDILEVKGESITLRQWRALDFMQVRLKDFKIVELSPPILNPLMPLKKGCVEPLNLLLGDIALFYGISKINTLDIIDALTEKAIFTPQSATLLKNAVTLIYQLRCQIHLEKGEQKEEISFYRLSADQQGILGTLNNIILPALYFFLKNLSNEEDFENRKKSFERDFHQVDLIPQAFEACLRDKQYQSSLNFVIKTLATSNLTPLDHKKYYTQLPSIDLQNPQLIDPFRRLYLHSLPNGALKNHLVNIPNTHGLRQSFLIDQEKLLQSLLTITTPFAPVFGIIIQVRHSSFETPRYLKAEIADVIIEKEDAKTKNHLKKQYPKSLHHVVAIQHNGIHLHLKEKPTHPMMEYAIHNLMYRIAGRLTPPTELVRFDLEVDGKKIMYPVLISETINGQSLSDVTLDWNSFTPAQKEQWSWMFLCTLLTRPGDGHNSNYLIDHANNIFCIDNDISFAEPVINEFRFLGEIRAGKIHFSSALFCFFKDAVLSPTVLEAFRELDRDLLLNEWIDDLIQKEHIYKNLFLPPELTTLYTEDKERQFKPEILFRKGTLATLNAQFVKLTFYLHQCLRSKTPVTPLDLLKQLIHLREDLIKDEAVGIYVYNNYKKSFEMTINERLRWILDRPQDQSLTTAQSDPICLGKVPTLEEIKRREKYGPEKAKEELLFRLICNNSNAISIREVNGKTSIKANFKGIDEERQGLILTALTFLYDTTLSAKTFSLQHCSVLPLSLFQYFLNKELTHLDLRYCSAINNNHMELIQDSCPQLEELYLSGCSNLTEIRGGFFQKTLSFPHLRELYLDECEKLENLFIEIPQLIILSSKKSMKLTNFYLPHFSFIFTMNCLDCPTFPRIIESCAEQLKIEKNLLEQLVKAFVILQDSPVTLIDRLFLQRVGGQDVIDELLKFNTPLTTLVLNHISIQDVTPRVKVLEINNSLTEIDLSFTGIKDIIALTDALKINPTLRSIKLTGNPLKNLTSLAEALKVNRSLTSIHLNSTKIRDVSSLAEALEINKTLTEIDLGYNQIIDISSLAKALEINKALTSIHLKHNQITDVSSLAEALKTNKSLTHIYLNYNKIPDSGADFLLEMLKINKSIEILYLVENPLAQLKSLAIVQALQTNKKER